MYGADCTVLLQLYHYNVSCHPLCSNDEHGLPDGGKHPCAHKFAHLLAFVQTHTHTQA